MKCKSSSTCDPGLVSDRSSLDIGPRVTSGHLTSSLVSNHHMMTPLLLLLVSPGLSFHLPGDEGRTDTRAPDNCQVEECQVRHIMLTSLMQASDSQPGQCIEITKCAAIGRKYRAKKDKYMFSLNCLSFLSLYLYCREYPGESNNKRKTKVSLKVFLWFYK